MNTTDQLLDTLYAEMSRIKQVMVSSRAHMLSELQLTRTQAEVLMALKDEAALMVSELADWLVVSHSAATQTIETMVKRGLVERRADEHDRRIVRAALSPAGQALAQRMQDDQRAWLDGALGSLSPEELELMITAYRTMYRQISQTIKTKKEAAHAN